MKSVLIAIAAMAASTFATPAQAQANNGHLNALTVDTLISLGQANGFTTRQTGDGTAPVVEMRTSEGLVFYAIGNACEQGTCTGLKLMGQHDPEGQITVSQINTLNRDIPPIKVWYDQERMVVERYLILNGGVSQANLAFEVSTFPAYLAAAIERVTTRANTDSTAQ